MKTLLFLISMLLTLTSVAQQSPTLESIQVKELPTHITIGNQIKLQDDQLLRLVGATEYENNEAIINHHSLDTVFHVPLGAILILDKIQMNPYDFKISGRGCVILINKDRFLRRAVVQTTSDLNKKTCWELANKIKC